jgi:predicted nucleotidyltransferase
MENIIFKCIVGSQAYGTNIEGSDVDIKGIYIQSPENVLERGYQEQVTVNKDEVYYEIKRFIELCCTGNPTMLELLYSPEDCIIYKHPIFDKILEDREKFLSKSCKHSFGGYAYAQIDKAEGLEKKMNWEKSRTERKTVLDFCYVLTVLGSIPLEAWLSRQRGPLSRQENYGVTKVNNAKDVYYIYPNTTGKLEYKGIVNLEETSNELRLSSIPKDQILNYQVMVYNKDGYTEHCKDYKSYQDWLANRNTQRYVDVDSHGQKIDGKNLLHCYRLLETGIEIATDKIINVRRSNAKFLIGIRKGEHNLEELLKQAKNKIELLKDAFDQSTLPDTVDRGYFLSKLVKIRQEYYKTENN